MTIVQRLENVSRHDLEAKVFATGRPVVLAGAVAGWPAVAVGRESDERLFDYLKGFDAGQPAGVYVGPPDIEGRFFYGATTATENFRFGPAPVAQILDRILSERTSPRPSSVYMQSAPVTSYLPGFAAENHLDLLPDAVAPRIWIGNRTVTRAHYDLNANIACVIAGRRRVYLFPPEQLPNLYPGPFDRTIGGVPVSMVDILNPDLERYPRFAKARAVMRTVELEPGDALYIPYGWWHEIHALSPVNVLVNYWWHDDRGSHASPYDALFHALLAIRDMPADQRTVWRNLFEYYAFGSHGDPVAHLGPEDRGSLGDLDDALVARIRKAIGLPPA
jgi:hypothetical protein